MTREEALAECRRLGDEHPDRATHSWIVRDAGDGDWTIVKLNVPARSPLGTMQEAKPKPPTSDDPRPAMWRDVGGPWAGG